MIRLALFVTATILGLSTVIGQRDVAGAHGPIRVLTLPSAEAPEHNQR